MSGGASEFTVRAAAAGNNEPNSIRFLGNGVALNKKSKRSKKKAGNKSNEGPVKNEQSAAAAAKADFETASVSSQQSKGNVEEMTGLFQNLLSSAAQAGLENFSAEKHGVKKYCGKKEKRTPPQFLREFESLVLSCLDDLTKAQYFAKTFDYDSFPYALAIPFHKGYKAARQYFLEMTWSNAIQNLEFQKLTMSEDDRELFGYYDEDDEEMFELYESSMIKLYIRAQDCGVQSSMGFKNLIYPKLPVKFRDEIRVTEYENLESFAAALHRHFVVSKVVEESDVIEDHNAYMYKFITGKSYYTGETASDSD